MMKVDDGVLLSGLQSDDDEDGASVHSTHAAGVAHEVIENGCELCPHLRRSDTKEELTVMFVTGTW